MRKQTTFQFVSFFLVFALLIQLLPVRIFAAAAKDVGTEMTESQEPVIIIGEEETLRTETGKHFRLSDGSNIAVSYGIPVHYQDESGAWQDIVNEPVMTYGAAGSDAYLFTNENLTTVFSANLEENRILTSVYEDFSVSMSLMDITRSSQRHFNREVIAEVVPSDVSALNMQNTDGWTTEDLLPDKLMSSMLYEDVFPDVDILYTVCGFNVKEEIIVKKAQTDYRYDFLLELDGLFATQNEDGSVSLRNAEDEDIYLIPAPFMMDGGGNISYDVSYSLTSTDAGSVLSVVADSAWINESSRIFPVKIDPSLILAVTNSNIYMNSSMYACYVQEGEPLYYGWSQMAYCGYGISDYDKNIYIYMYINDLPALPAGSVVTNAELSLYQYTYYNAGCASMPIGLYEVTGENPREDKSYYIWIYNFNWNTKPEFDRDNIIDYRTLTTADSGTYVTWNMTELAKKWYAEKTENRMITLAPTQNGYGPTYGAWQIFLTYSDLEPPLFVVSYRNNTGIEPYYTYNTLEAASAGTAYVADASGQLKAAKNLVSYTSSANPFSLNLLYNSDYFVYDNEVDNQPISTLGLDMSVGSGWTLDCVQKIEPVTISGVAYLKYHDGDGTVHYFLKDTTMDPTGKYYFDEDGLGLKIISTGTNDYEMMDDYGNRWIFTDNYLTATKDSDNNQILINYADNRISSIVQRNNGCADLTVATLTYSENNLASVTDAAGNVYSLTYCGTKLTSIQKNGKSVAQYSYDGYRLSRMKDTESSYALDFTYEHGRIAHFQEIAGSDIGAQVSVTYPNHSQTTYRDYGSDRTAGTEDDILTHYLFDYADRTVNVYCTDASDNILGASNAAYSGSSTTDKQNNRTLRSATIGKAGQQLLMDSGLESSEEWTFQGTSQSSENPRTGQYAVRGTLIEAGTQSAQKASAALDSGSIYTLSAYINTKDITSVAGSGIYLKVTDEGGNSWTSEAVNYTTSTAVDSGWVRVSVTFTAEFSGSHTLAVYNDGAFGTFYADDFQLELGEAPSSYNLVENGSMELHSGWIMGTGASISTNGGVASSGQSLQISGNPESTATSAYQDIPVNLPGSKTYLLSGWVKANAVPDNCQTVEDPAQDLNKQCGLRAILTYSDNSTEYHYVPFNTDLSTWQFVSYTLVPRAASKTVSSIRIVCAYEGNANVAYFDNISLLRQAAQIMRYDDDGNLVSVTSTDLSTDVDTYENGNLIKSVTGGYGTFQYTYDETYTHRLVSATNGQLTQTMGYDGVGNVISTTLSGNSTQTTITTSASYDSNGNRLTSVTDATGATVSYAYGDANSQMMGLPTSVTDPGGTVTATAYDTFGRISQISVENWAELDYTYSSGNLSAITRTEDDTTTQTYRFTYDAFGNALRASVGSCTLATYEYEPGNGQMKKQTFGNGDKIFFTYDNLGRTKTVTYDDPTVTHDDTIVTYIYNGEGALHSITEKQGTNTTLYLYTYDSIGRPISCEKKVNGETILRTYQEFNEHNQQTHYGYQMGDVSYSESYTYNSDGTLNQIAGSDGQTVTMNYDGLQRLSGKTIKQGDTTVVSYTYSYRDISETATTSQIASVQVTAANTATTYAYTYDSNGNILSVSDGTNTTSYVYDSANQLLRENNQAANKTWVWTYDNAGNIQSKSEYAYTTGELGEAVDMVSYGYDNDDWGDLLTSYDGVDIDYDEIGNPVDDGTWEYAWQHGRELERMSDGTTAWTFTYDANGMRTSRTDGTTTYKYVYNGGSLVQMTVGSNTLYFTSDTVTYNGVTYYYVKNLQGDVTAIVDGSGATVATYVYDAWGNLISDEPAENTVGHLNPIRYRGYVFDSETTLYYLQSRYYDPELGRFINADSYASTGQGIFGNNMFAYCNNNPVMRVDFDGCFSITTWWDDMIEEVQDWIEKKKEEAENSEDGTTFVGIGFGGAFIFAFSGLTGITTDNKGNIGLMTSWFGGAGTPSASINAAITTTNAPTIDNQAGWSYVLGASIDAGVGAGGEVFLFEDPETGNAYYGGTFVASAGVSVPSDAHVGLGYSKIWMQFNIYKAAYKACDLLKGE